MINATRLIVNRKDFAQARLEHFQLSSPGDNEILIKTEQFGMTANNVTYALSGDMIGYWKFFPIESDDWGIVPVWGFAEVIESRCGDIPVGSRFWGFLPMSSHVLMRPVSIKENNFVDGTEHRQPLPELYNRYQRTENDSPELVAAADARSVMFPLLYTGYVLADYLEDNRFFGAEQVIIASASSKTALGTAHYIKQLASRPIKLVGLTSASNIAFVREMDFYDQSVGYDDAKMLESSVPTVFVDMSGNGPLIATIHRHFQDGLKASIGVGATHWDAPRNRGSLPGPPPTFFFAPAQVLKREGDWGPGKMARRIEAANLQFLPKIEGQIHISKRSGSAEVQSGYEAMASGNVPPATALILSF